MSENRTVPVRAYLIHITHYDPVWFDRKEREEPFDLALGLDVVRTLGEVGFNTLIVDLADGVQYRTFPDLRRHYSVPIEVVEELVSAARAAGLQVIPKLNFSRSAEPRRDHNYWFRPYNELPDGEAYWSKAFELIDEVVDVVAPTGSFHVGMDEDFLRTPDEYVSAVTALHDGLAERGLRTVMWNDTAHLSAGMFGCVEKTLAAENETAGDIVHVLWDYTPLKARTAARVRDMRAKGLEVWIAPGRRPNDVEQWTRLALESGCSGMVMTAWAPVNERNRQRFIDLIREVGPVYAQRGKPQPARPAERPASHTTEVAMRPADSMDDPVVAPNRLAAPLAEVPYLLPPDAYVRNWTVLGPFPFDPADYPGPEAQEVIDDGASVGGDESTLAAGEEGAQAFGAAWQRYVPPQANRFPQVIDLRAMYGGSDYALAYAIAHVHCEQEMAGCSIFLGADDYVKVWLNGESMHTWAEGSRAIVQDDDRIEGIALREGWNKLLVKCVNLKATWGFILRIADPAGRPIVTD